MMGSKGCSRDTRGIVDVIRHLGSEEVSSRTHLNDRRDDRNDPGTYGHQPILFLRRKKSHRRSLRFE